MANSMRYGADGFPIEDPAEEEKEERAARGEEQNVGMAFAPGTIDGVPLPAKDTAPLVEHVAKLTTHDDLPLCADCPAPRQASCLLSGTIRGTTICDRFHVDDLDAAQAAAGRADPVVKTKRTRKPRATAPIPPAREDGTMRVVRLESENVKRLRAVTIDPEGGVVVVAGRNAQGKSSVLDSIEMALAGKRAIPAEPIRHGEAGARTVIDLDGLRVTRTYTPSGGGTLRVERANGDRPARPQELLDELFGALTFDPLAFARATPKAQVEMLRQVTGLDTSDLDTARSEVYAQRTDVGRRRDAAKARCVPITGPVVEVSVGEIVRQIQEAGQKRHERDQFDLARAKAQGDRAAAARRILAIETELTNLRAQIVRLDALVALPCTVVVPDVAALQSALACAEDTNRQARANADAAKQQAAAESLNAEYVALTEKIEGIDAARAARVAGATMPIEGLALDAECVRYQGVPLSQASQAESLRVSLAVGAALATKARILLVRDASVLDAEQMALVRAWATERGYQVWLERVGTGDAGAVVIEDGSVVA
jgi:hypothetical protein